ncbi:MAG: hypothetical protein GXC94_07280 [Comamonadaceae bacterium]|nr:hypothetical protein [Comamonadaceae bacterium]
MELLNDARILHTILFVVPVGILLAWVRLRERQWMLSSKRKRAAREMFKKSAWKKAAPLDFHFAMTDAFGQSVELNEMAFIEARQAPVQLLLNRIKAGPFVQYVEEEGTYVDPRRPWAQRWLPFGVISFGSILAASFLVTALLFLVLHTWANYGTLAATVVGAAVGVLGVLWLWLMLIFSQMADAAKRVLRPERHRAAGQLRQPRGTESVGQANE